MAYQWVAQCLKPIEQKCEPHLLQQVSDKIVAALLEVNKAKKRDAVMLQEIEDYMELRRGVIGGD